MPLYLFFYFKKRDEKYSNFNFLMKPWKYAILGLLDLEANYLVVLAYEYTNIMSVQLFACLTTPCVLLLSVIILKATFGLTHICGAAVAIGGLILLFVLDANGTSQVGGKSQVLGDVFCVGSSILYAVSNVVTEWFIKPEENSSISVEPTAETTLSREESECNPSPEGLPIVEEVGENEEEPCAVPAYIPMFEYLALMSLFALLFSIIQFFATEWKSFAPKRSAWTNMDWLYQIFYGISMLGVYTLMPMMFIICSACFVNLSLLTSNVYAVIWNAIVFHVSPTLWFLLTWVLITIGIILFNITSIVDYLWLRRIDRPWLKFDEEEQNINSI